MLILVGCSNKFWKVYSLIIDKYETEKKQNNDYCSMDSAMRVRGMYEFVQPFAIQSVQQGRTSDGYN